MSNHIHFTWQALPGKTPEQVQQSFMKYTAQQIKFDLVANHPQVLEKFRVNAKDRTCLPIAIGIGKGIHWVLNCEQLKCLYKNWSTYTGIQ